MVNKKIICILMVLLSAILACACANNSDTQQGQVDTTFSSDPTKDTEISIPTDSGLSDSVFGEESRKPTITDNQASAQTPDQTTQDPSDPTEPSVEATAPDTTPAEMTYEDFVALTPEEQRLYQESFNNLDAFFAWYTAAKEKYEKENPPIDIDGPIDLGKY